MNPQSTGEGLDMARRKGKTRKNPQLTPVPKEEQRYIVRKMTQKGMKSVVSEPYSYSPDLLEDIELNLCYFHREGTYVLLSLRPRPAHVATWKLKNHKVVHFEVDRSHFE